MLAQPGVRWLIAPEGINGLGTRSASARELIAAYEQIIVRAHGRGIRAYGATLLSCEGSSYYNPELKAARQEVNTWIRDSGRFDATTRNRSNPRASRTESRAATTCIRGPKGTRSWQGRSNWDSSETNRMGHHNLRRMAILVIGVMVGTTAESTRAEGDLAGEPIVLNDNGAWSWFMDDRAVVLGDTLVVGSVRAVGTFAAGMADPNGGNIEIATYGLATGAVRKMVLHPRFEQDDHDAPALLVRPDRRVLAMYSKHGQDRRVLYRFSEPSDPLTWGPPQEFELPGQTGAPFKADNVTYNNPFRLAPERLVNFYRGIHLDPNLMISDDDGRTWRYGGHLFLGKGGYSPYLRYASDGRGTIHFVATEDHPRNFDNSLYHGFLRDGQIHRSDGTVLGPASTGVEANLATWDLTRVFAGDPDNVAWVDDVKLDRAGHPRVLFSVKKDGRGTHGKGGMDIRFHVGRWDGAAWQTREIAHAGTRLYAGEDDYTGLAVFDRNDLDVVYLATNSDPTTGGPLVSRADDRRHYELYQGSTGDSGATWRWEALTADSATDNLRPVVPSWDDRRTIIVWLRGQYRNNRGEWTTAVVARVLPRPR